MKNRYCFKRIRSLLAVVFGITVFSLSGEYVLAAPADDQEVVIVIDPGHGGDSTGAEYYNLSEKDLNLTVSNYIKDDLEQYDHVKVFLTRTDDIDSSYAVRMDYAKAKKADYIISIHFNESDAHDQIGSQIYVPSKKKLSEEILPVAFGIADSLESAGIVSGGIYSCVDDHGNDYYGLLRQAARANIPSLIVEHLYMDRKEYLPFINSEEALSRLAALDAEAIAKALQLHSEALAVDDPEKETPGWEVTALDESFSHPSLAKVSVSEYEQIKDDSCLFTLKIQGKDEDKDLYGYRVSVDGGKHFRPLIRFKDGREEAFYDLVLRKGDSPAICVLVFNEDHLSVVSDPLNPFLGITLKQSEEEEAVEEPSDIIAEPIEPGSSEAFPESSIYEDELRFGPTKSIVIVFGAIAGLSICLILLILQRKEKKDDKHVC